MANDRRCPLNSSPEWPTFTDITPSAAGERSDCEAIRVRARCREVLSLAETPPHSDPLRARGEREQNCSSLADPLRGSRAHAYARNPTIANSVGHSPLHGGNAHIDS